MRTIYTINIWLPKQMTRMICSRFWLFFGTNTEK